MDTPGGLAVVQGYSVLRPNQADTKRVIEKVFMPEKVNLAEKLQHITEHWSPRIVAEVQGMHVKLVKFQGEFVWHHHEQEDEMFLVVKGQFTMRFRNGDRVLNEGEFIVVPRGVEHCPVAAEEVWVMLFEPASTLNTGNVHNERTIEKVERI